MNCLDIKEWIPKSPDAWAAIASWLTFLAALAALMVARRGLSIWKDQEKWKRDEGLARRILLAIQRYKADLYAIRYPGFLSNEMLLEECAGPLTDGADSEIRNAAMRHERRRKCMRDARAELDALLIESDIVWGDGSRKRFEAVNDLQHELESCFHFYFQSVLLPKGTDQESAMSQFRACPDIRYDRMSGGDQFRKRFDKAIGPLENLLQQKLDRDA